MSGKISKRATRRIGRKMAAALARQGRPTGAPEAGRHGPFILGWARGMPVPPSVPQTAQGASVQRRRPAVPAR